MMEEFVFNIWFTVDIGTNLSTDFIIKPYNLVGSDEDKYKLLNILAETDYKSGVRIRFSENINTYYGDGQVAKGCLHSSAIKSHFESNIEYFALQAEKQLPLQFKFGFEGDGTGKVEKIKQTLPQNPLYLLTMLFENEYGEMKPYTTAENITWIELERIRMGVKLNEQSKIKIIML